jgi:hypothetical protein
MALILPVLFPQVSKRAEAWLRRLVGMVFMPLLVLLAVVANASLRAEGGDDCLGYTALAERPVE